MVKAETRHWLWRHNVNRMLAAALIMALPACDSNTGSEPELLIAVLSGANQIGGFAARLPQPVVVRVTDLAGNPVAGQQVVWRVVAGGGQTDSTTTITDASGQTAAKWLLGFDAGTHLLSVSARNASISVRATGEFQFGSVTVGFRHACALSTDGQAFCWGANESGQLGDGTSTTRQSPTRSLTSTRFTSLAAGWSHTCGISISGEAFCWGNNQATQLGIGSTAAFRHAPTPIASSLPFVSVSAGFVHTCGVSVDGTAYCWGSNGRGQLGSGVVEAVSPVAVSGSTKFKAVSAGEFHTCAIATDGAAYCWGWNSSGELGIAAPFGEERNAPTRVANLANVVAIAAGVRHTCAVTANLYCWGRNAFGEVGLPPFIQPGTPSQIDVPQPLTMIGAGNVLSCGASVTTAFCWGSDGFHETIKPEPRLTGNITSLSVGFDQVCVVSAGDVYCWGANNREPVKIGRPK